MLETKRVSFSHLPSEPLLREVSLSLSGGDVIAVLGPNGSGKTTLLRLMLGLIKPQEGSVTVDGEEVLSLRPMARARKLSYVPQDYISGTTMTVFESILLGRRPYINWGPGKEDIGKVYEVMELLNLSSLSERPLHTLSGGQKQKVVLGRALAQDTPYILLDEPTGNLDLKHQVEVLECLADMAGQGKAGVVIAMHDINLASHYSNKTLLINSKGEVVSGLTKEIFNAENLGAAYGIEMLSQKKDDSEERIWFPKISKRGGERELEGKPGGKSGFRGLG
jgi:iron complex transport system ATP-binding protein